jgi:hypothetical protein
MDRSLLFLRAHEREYLLDWETLDAEHESRYAGPREDGLIALQRLLP